MKRLAIFTATIVVALGAVLSVSAATNAPHEGLSVSPPYVSDSGDGPGGCRSVSGGVACVVTVKNTGTEREEWIAQVANGDNPSSTTFKPDGGFLASGKTLKVTITTSDCTLESFAFTTFDEDYGGAVLFNCG
jgi:hypothetical protein